MMPEMSGIEFLGVPIVGGEPAVRPDVASTISFKIQR